MFELHESVLRDECGLTKNAPVIVGVSGGADSLALMDVLVLNGYQVVVAHLNHKLRPDSDGDASSVEQMARRMNLPVRIKAVAVNEFAHQNNLSIEVAARQVRYRFLFEVAHKFGAQAVAVGHNADDQVETVLMHFLQGAGMRGLRGMTYRTLLPNFDPEIPVIRPLLSVWRADISEYCSNKRLHPLEDSTNRDESFLRNRLRHSLIPQLEEYNPRFRETVWRTAQALAGDYEALSEITDDAWQAALTDTIDDNTLAFELKVLKSYQPGIQRSLLRRACRELCADVRDIDFAAVGRVLDFLDVPQPGVVIDLAGGVKFFVEDNEVILTSDEIHLPGNWPRLEKDNLPVSIPGQLSLPGGWEFSAELWEMPALARAHIQKNRDPFKVWLDADKLSGELALRPRRAGDRFEPFGMDGHTMKLSDYFINEKIPRRLRDHWPLLCMDDETIAWVPGYRPAHTFCLNDTTQRVLHFIVSKQEIDKPKRKK